MKLHCAACGAEMTLDVAIAHEGARDAVLAALQLPAPLGKALIAYLGFFRPAKRQLSHDRVAAILGELLPMIQAAKVERHGREWPAPVDYWKFAIDDMVAKRDLGRLTLPLKSHGYLLEIIAGIANKAEGKTEAKAEQARAHPYARVVEAPEGPAPTIGQAAGVRMAPMPEETRRAIEELTGRRRGQQG